MNPLALPRIDARTPCVIMPQSAVTARASLSRFLIDAQVFDETDLPATWDDPVDACQQALDHWIAREIGHLHCLSPQFSMSYKLDGYGYPDDDETVRIRWSEQRCKEWPVGAGLEALDGLFPGLGETVLQVLRWQSRSVYPMFLPDAALDVATYLYWQGSEDEEQALDTMCVDEAERETLRGEMAVTRALIDKSYPAWAFSWPRSEGFYKLSACVWRLRRAMKELANPAARQIAADAFALARLRFDKDFYPDEESGEYIAFGGVLSWREQDVTVRIYDDLLQWAWENGEFCDYMGEAGIPLGNPALFGQWRDDMRTRFRAIGLIDRLIHGLSARCWTDCDGVKK